ncbi:MAG: hypothetical protein GY805_24555 [Chloroflexi bacterium]|nr:hypothetical protein [Chloroflexota bacterium]
MLLDILFPSTLLLPGALGGLISGGVGWFFKKETFRWTIFFAFFGMLSTGILLSLNNTRDVTIYSSDIQIFIPLFALLGGGAGVIYKKLTNSNEWSWIIIFIFFGALIGTVSQLRGIILWIIIGGSLIGVVTWYIGNLHINWTIAIMGFGATLAWSLLLHNSNREIGTIVAAGLSATLGWLIHDDDLRWFIAFIMLGTLVGSMIEWFSFWDSTYLLIGGIISGTVGYSIRVIKFRGLVAFAYFGYFIFSFIRWHWHIIKMLDLPL